MLAACTETAEPRWAGLELLSTQRLRLTYDGEITGSDPSAGAFRVSLARRNGDSTTYSDAGFFFEPETISCCDLTCGAVNLANTECTHSGMCSTCTRVGPANLVTVMGVEIVDGALELELNPSLGEAACDELAAASALLFAHYAGGEALRANDHDLEPLGSEWVTRETSISDLDSLQLTQGGQFPLIPLELGVQDCAVGSE